MLKVSNTDKTNSKISSSANMECPICCEKYTKTARPKIECPSCDLEACKSCVKRYLLDKKTPKCMQCNVEWGDDFCSKILGSWMRGEFRTHMKRLLFDMEKARFPETMPEVENTVIIRRMEKERISMNNEIETLYQQIYKLKKMKEKNVREQTTISISGKKSGEKKIFTRACPDNDCNGFLSSQWKCGVCEKWSCPKCFEIIGQNKEAHHVCDPNTLATAQMMKKETKPCPSCSAAIFKIEGCDQMWCTQCQTPFSWRTGRKVNGTIHNPHYHQWMRHNGGALLQPGARLCGGLPTLQQIRTALVNLKGNKIVRRLGAEFINHQSWMLSLIRLNEGWSFDSYRYIDKTIVMMNEKLCMKKDSSPGGIMELDKEWWTRKIINEQEQCVLIPPKSMIAILKMLQTAQRHLRGIQHFNLVELDDLRRNCQRQRDNKDLRIKYMLNETTEELMKTQLVKRDTKWKKMNSILQIYELYSQVAEEAMRIIYNDRTLKGIVDALRKKENVRIYCNEALLNISKTYNQVVGFIKFSGYTAHLNYKGCGRDSEYSTIGDLLTNKLEKSAWLNIIEKNNLYGDDNMITNEITNDYNFVNIWIGACHFQRKNGNNWNARRF
jgi:hypothetical protein